LHTGAKTGFIASMSKLLIGQYFNQLAQLRKISGVSRESVIREAFKDLLKAWGRTLDLTFVPEHEIISAAKVRSYVDGALLHDIRVPFGYWEAKDEADDLNAEIVKKLARGYPQSNIIFEDSRTAVLIQNKVEILRVAMDDTEQLKTLLDLFFGYQRPEIADFKKAIAQFKLDLPEVLKALRERIDAAYAQNKAFANASKSFLIQAKESINPAITDADIREMLIQHILTEDIFARVFGQSDFHRENNVAKALYGLEAKFFTGTVKQQTLKALEPYYAAIRSTAALISSHSEKQGFLKAIYENFYKVYNPKAADRLGVVYTPAEIVRFMVESADYLCEKHFGKNLIDKKVEILDPATGTGTFIVELLQHFSGQPEKLKYKYSEELHANEVAILPYYVANLNIEATYAAITGEYAEFPNLCFVDTLDNIAGLKQATDATGDLLGALSEENIERIKRQNQRKISVVIGNPPYNANQQNENDNNKNRKYPEIDKRIKATYIKQSTAQKTKLYDMYARFFRWASDRIEENGIVALITNRSFLDARNFDGFRKTVLSDFSAAYIVDLGGDYKKKGVGGGGNVFGIGTGVAISFWIKKTSKNSVKCKIKYYSVIANLGDEKLAWLGSSSASSIKWQNIAPTLDGYWIDNPADNFGNELPIATKGTKETKIKEQERAIFKKFSLGISTNRDDWLYDDSKAKLQKKVAHLIQLYDALSPKLKEFPNTLKWSETLKRRKRAGAKEAYSKNRIQEVAYRPFSKSFLYCSDLFIDRPSLADNFFPSKRTNQSICFTDPTAQKPWMTSAIDTKVDLHYVGSGAGTIYLGRYRYEKQSKIDNITNWAFAQFNSYYDPSIPITKDDIFSYVYAVLNDPVYRETYAQYLKREFPRIPLYSNFVTWRDWGQTLLNLHINYESAPKFPLQRIDTPDKNPATRARPARPILRSNPVAGNIFIDTETQLTGIPTTAWDYKLGNRAAIDWVLDQRKEKTPRDPTIREKFNTYRFADYKEETIELLSRVITVSLETIKITDAMRKLPRL
jgi:predicted helicase